MPTLVLLFSCQNEPVTTPTASDIEATALSSDKSVSTASLDTEQKIKTVLTYLDTCSEKNQKAFFEKEMRRNSQVPKL